MTRINTVPVETLSNGHLATEHYELVRVYRLVRGAVERGERPDDPRNPDSYRTGAGHVRFFYPRLGYIKKREIELHLEMLFRGIPLVREEEDTSDIPPEWFGSYEPTEESKIINQARLDNRNTELEKKVMRGYFVED